MSYFKNVCITRRAMLEKLSGGNQCFQRRLRTPDRYSAKAKLLVKLIKYENTANPCRWIWEL